MIYIGDFLNQSHYSPDENTVVLGSESAVKHLIDAIKKESVGATWTMELKQDASDHLIYYMDMETLRPEINKNLRRGRAAAILGAFGPFWDDTDALIGSVGVGEKSTISIKAICSTKARAKKVKGTVDSLILLGKNCLEQARVAFTRETDVHPEGKYRAQSPRKDTTVHTETNGIRCTFKHIGSKRCIWGV